MNFKDIMEKYSYIFRDTENNGLKKGDREQRIKLLLTHAYMAVRMYWAMSLEDRVQASEWHRKFRRSFSFKKFLKERKRSTDKGKFPPNPLYKEIASKDKLQKTSLSPVRVKRTLKVRKEEFWNELLTFEEKYDRQMLLAFFYYWAEQVTGQRKMRLELEKSWDTGYRLAAWSKRSFAKNDEAAALRLEREKQKMTKQAASSADQQAVAAKRNEDNERLEQEIAERKQGAVSYEEYLKLKAAIKREQNQACLGFAEREQARCETSKVKNEGNAEIGTGA